MENLGIHTEVAKVDVLHAPIKFDLLNKCGVLIDSFVNAEGEVVYRLQWHDYVVNEWNEYYGSLSLALARVAVLAVCVEEEANDVSVGFKNSSDDFVGNAYRFFSQEVK